MAAPAIQDPSVYIAPPAEVVSPIFFIYVVIFHCILLNLNVKLFFLTRFRLVMRSLGNIIQYFSNLRLLSIGFIRMSVSLVVQEIMVL